MELIILLVVAHFIGDFYLQPKQWVDCRNTNHARSKGLYKHIATHFVLSIFAALLSDLPVFTILLVSLSIAVTHFLADLWKSHQATTLRSFLIDQLVHIIVILGIAFIVSDITFAQISTSFSNLNTLSNAIFVTAYLLVCKPASVLISLALRKHTQHLAEEAGDKGLQAAGAWIGYLERCLTISFIFMGQFAGTAFLVAAKTIFRFGDLTKNNDMKLTEYMMLGTLLSYSIAIFVGWNALYLMRVL
ncbi:DUF3307 domain-containing protein [Psychrosphaera haliotis]|uniref:DUF3307 domain-containing protein n=1 Tax=Psychrosphaera haliotis TaxID=555083 RepID=A0A6N8F9N4_9GAMM|nr:DUF3307 domain-containing protein [Psychrosphaera haliotis]MUH71231.1 DUF3307 domain-containing protein [Psychrosphaera haliotis]